MKSLTIDTYNAYAVAYDDETTGFWRDFPTPFIDAFASRVKGDVINIGSGPGRDALLLKESRGQSEFVLMPLRRW
jgi:hypothetical protein